MLEFDYISEKYAANLLDFKCTDDRGDNCVEDFLKEEALQLHRQGAARTRLYFDENQKLVGYFTLYNDLVYVFKSQTERYKREYEWDLPNYRFLPAIKLHYLGVDERYREKGCGTYILFEAIYLARQLSNESGAIFMTIEALWSAFEWYEKRGFIGRQRDPKFYNMILKLHELD